MLELKLNPTQERYNAGEPVDTKITLRNTGSEPVKVNGRLALNAPFSPEEFREVAFTVNDPTGAPMDFQLKVNIGEPEASDFKTLAPGEAIEDSYNLARYYDLQKPGTYTIQASYQNQSEPGGRNGTRVWKGEIKSPIARITVL